MKITLTGGNFVTERQLMDAVDRYMDSATRTAAGSVQRAGMAETPVVSGHLRASWVTSQPLWQGKARYIEVKPDSVYARRVNLTSRRNKGYFERGVRAAYNSALNHLRGGVSELARHLFIKK